jgi:hypothetical protein
VTLVGFASFFIFPLAGVLAILAIRQGPRRWIGVAGLLVALGGLAFVSLAFPTPQCSLE